ncbi:MAG TPA: ABC transporter permease [Bryobacteraceae bacterium]|nr:ABC transporter permease [Bryobacteraceae bacterium]
MRRHLQRLWTRAFSRPADDELAAELASHLDMQTDDNIHAGMSPEQARRAAVLKFGSLEAAKENHRDARGFPFFHALHRDIRHAFRSFLRRPVFTTIAVLSLALGIGSTTAVFSIVDCALFRSPAYNNPDQLVSIGVVAPLIAPYDWMFSGPYQEWRRASPETAFETLTSWTRVSDCDLASPTPARLACADVEHNFLSVLGVSVSAGRNFTREEDREGGPAAALISAHLWRTRFGSDSTVVGKRMSIDGITRTIVGVLPDSFELPSAAKADVLVPQRLREGAQRQRIIRVIGRLRPGVTPARAAAQLAGPFQLFTNSAPADFRKAVQMQLRIETLKDQQTKQNRLASWVLLGAVFSVLMIACANVSNLLLTEAAARRKELAMRAALGATRVRLIAQRLTEAFLLAGWGACVGLALAYGLLRAAAALAPEGILRLHEAALDARVLLFTIGISAVTAITVGFTASVEKPRQEELTGGRISGSRTNLFKRCFIAAQVAASIVLLTLAGLLVTSLRNLQAAPMGFAPENVIAASFTLNAQNYTTAEKQIAFTTQIEDRLRQLPGVEAVAIADTLPPGDDPRSVPFVAMVGGGDRSAPGMSGTVMWRYVTSDYFRAMGIRVLQGRPFTIEDARADGQVIIVNETLAARLFPDQAAVGKEAWNSVARSRIVGVAADVRNAGVDKLAQPEFYVVRRHQPGGIYDNQRPPYGWRHATALIRTALPEHTATELARSEFAQLDPALPVDIITVRQHVDKYLQRPRFTGWVLTVFAAMGLLLAAVGLYGVISYTVAERTREIGVRIALGAATSAIVRMTLHDGMKWVAIGAITGLVLSLAVGRIASGLLFGVRGQDPVVYGAALAILTVTGLSACAIPARRAARVDPAVTLRNE